MDSFEDLRDAYKGSRKCNHIKVKSNGATYSNRFRDLMQKSGNTIIKNQGNNNEIIDDINYKYAVNDNNLVYSLNKKGRWNMVKDIKRHMNEFALDDEDVRLFETRSRIGVKENCIEVHKSKGKQIRIHSKYGNTQSIISNDRLDALKARNPEAFVKKPKNNVDSPQRIVINIDENGDEDDLDDEFTQYKVEYAPNVDVLKYNSLFEFNPKDRVLSKRFTNVLGDEGSINNLQELEDIELEDEDYDDIEDQQLSLPSKTHVVSLNELINLHAKNIVDRRTNEKVKNVEVTEKEIQKLVYITRQNSLQIPIEKTQNQTKSQVSNKNVNSQQIRFQLSINKATLESDVLKLKFNSNYSEAYNTWPRIVTINMTDDIIEELVYKYKICSNNYDIKAYLILRELSIYEQKYEVLVKLNINEFNFDIKNESVWNFDELYQVIINQISMLPIEVFNIKEKIQNSQSGVNVNHSNDELPNIAAKNVCKQFDEVKQELLEKWDNVDSSDEDATMDSSISSIEDEFEVKERFNSILEQKKCSCSVCFDADLSISECTILKNCAHAVCNTCWKYYIDSRINNSMNGGKLCCPVCTNELELSLINYFSSDINKFDRYVALCIEQVLFVINNYKWCPSPYCNKVLKVDLLSTPYGILSCECGYKTCLKCNMAPHFPAKCSQIAKYYNELKAKNDYKILQQVDSIYTGAGKKCPTCYTFMEKNGGCNRMTCRMCSKEFCWNCCKIWSEHLKLTDGEHDCVEKSDKKNIVVVEFSKKNNTPIKIKDSKTSHYENSINHRRGRSNAAKKERSEHITRLLNSIKHKNLCTGFEDLSLHDQCKLQLLRKKEIRVSLQKVLSFLNELHFVCEHSYVLLREKNIEVSVKNLINHILNNLELILSQIEYKIENGTGIKIVEELEDLMKKGLNCLSKMSSLKV